jgi:pilus assembly protein CpaB
MRAGAFISLVLALVLGGAAAYMAANWMQGRATAGISVAPVNDRVVVAARPLNFGTQLKAEDLVQVPWPAGRMPDGAFSSIEELLKDGERTVLSTFQANEPILVSKVTGPGQRASLSALIEDGMRAVTIRVDEVRGVAGFVLPGERVDVVLTQSGSGGDNVSDILLQNVRVLAVDQAINEKADKPTVARAVTLEVTTDQAQKIILASDIGKLSLILRQAGSAVAQEVRRITRSDLSLPEPVAEMPRAQENVAPASRARTIGVVRGTTRSEYTISR